MRPRTCPDLNSKSSDKLSSPVYCDVFMICDLKILCSSLVFSKFIYPGTKPALVLLDKYDLSPPTLKKRTFKSPPIVVVPKIFIVGANLVNEKTVFPVYKFLLLPVTLASLPIKLPLS